MIRSLKIVFFITLISISFSALSYWVPLLAEEISVPSLTTGIINPYIPTQTWIDAYITEEDKIKALADIQPGSAIFMRELASRFTAIYYAVRSGNWKLADYQLDYARKNMQFNRVTRPKRKELFDAFLASSLGDKTNPASGSLQEAINAKNVVAFNRAFKSAQNSCNACHVATDHAYIIYKLPKGGSEQPLLFAPVE